MADREKDIQILLLQQGLATLIGWIEGSDCYKHLPREALIGAKEALHASKQAQDG